MGKTSLFEKKFKELLKSVSSKKNNYNSHEEDENTVGGGTLGPAAAIGHSDSSDWYATGDYRKPFALGGIQTRNGMLNRRKKRKKKKAKK